MKNLPFPFTICIVLLFAACGSDHEEKEPVVEPTTTGTISFTLPNGITASSTSPAVVTQGQPLDMEISQKSSYTDANGSVYTCEPKASIKLHVKQDTLYAKDLQTLISITESSDVSEIGINPSQHKILQKFNVGGQEVVFDLAYEVYTYVNSRQTSIEMPYIKVNSAKYGAATPKETRSANPASVSGIRLKPLGAMTRGLTSTTSQAYEVNVSFNLELEGVNTKEATTQTLSFEANYVGIVETSTTLPSPATSFSYKLEVLDGTSNTSSPFELQKGKTLSLRWNEDSRYSYFSPETLEEKTVPFEPKAWVKLAASQDTIWTEAKETLEKVTLSEPVISTEGVTPAATTGKWVCDIGGQTLTLDYGYEAYADETVQDTTLAMPYIKLELPEIKSVTLKYLDGETISDVDADVYEITVRITQELKTVNTANPSSETLEYVVKYIGAEKIKLVKVTYRKDWQWEAPHDNIALNHRAFVYRDRTYSNGVTITDTFMDLGHFDGCRINFDPPLPYISYNIEEEIKVENEDGTFIYSPAEWDMAVIDDSARVRRWTIGVPDLNKIRCHWSKLPNEESYYGGGWENNTVSLSYEDAHLDISLKDAEVIGADSISNQPSGWYFYYLDLDYVPFLSITMYYGNNELYSVAIPPTINDQYLVIDGQLIHFRDGYGPIHSYMTEEDTTLDDGTPAKAFTTYYEITYLGKKLSGTGIVTVYQRKSDQQAAPTTAPTQQIRYLSPLLPEQSDTRQKTYLPKGEYRYGFISGGDIHGRGKGPRTFTADDDLRSVIRQQGVKVEMK